MSVLLLPLSLILWTPILRRLSSSWKESYLLATLFVGGFLALVTEGLSLFRLLTPIWARITLSFVVLAALALMWSSLPRVRWQLPSRSNLASFFQGGLRWLWAHRAYLFAWSFPAVILVITALLAWKSPPNTPDALSYRLGRMLHWAQNGDVEPYPTHILRQIYQFPWAAEALLWLRLLSGSDRWVNFLQWWALGSGFVVLSLISRVLFPDLSPGWSLWAVATLPMAILQASSTQNDLVVSYWLLVFVYFLLRYRQTPTSKCALAASLALGLALRTKATAYLWAFPFALWFVVLLLRRSSMRVWIGAALCLGLMTIGPLARNTKVFGHPLGNASLRQTYLNELYTPAALASNLVRNVAVHYQMDHFLKIPAFYTRVEGWVRDFHRAVLGIDEAHPQTTWGGYDFKLSPVRVPDEDVTGAPYHLLLLLPAVSMGLLAGSNTLRRYVGVWLLSWLVFIALLKWQPWIVRLQLPGFLLGMPLLGRFLARLARPKRLYLGILVVAFLVYQARKPLLFNRLRPFLGQDSVWVSEPEDLMFRAHAPWREPFTRAIAVVTATGCDQIGFVFDEGGWEYPWWYWLAPRYPHLRLEHVQVTNPTAPFAQRLPPFSPCVLVVSHPEIQAPSFWIVDGVRFRQVYRDDSVPLIVYQREGSEH